VAVTLQSRTAGDDVQGCVEDHPAWMTCNQVLRWFEVLQQLGAIEFV